MANSTLNKIFNRSIIQLPAEVLISLLSEKNRDFITIKDEARFYKYTNDNWANLFGYKKSEETYNKKDIEFCRDKRKVKIYSELDDQVFDTGHPLQVCEEIYPERNKITKLVSGTLYPIMNDVAKPIGILGVFNFKNGIWQLTLDLVFSLADKEIEQLLIKRSYKITVYNREISLSKREIQCLIALMKGKYACEIALALNLKRSTIEFYLDNLKNKLGAISKSSLINAAFEQKIIQQLIL